MLNKSQAFIRPLKGEVAVAAFVPSVQTMRVAANEQVIEIRDAVNAKQHGFAVDHKLACLDPADGSTIRG
jgi:hypothetical protein